MSEFTYDHPTSQHAAHDAKPADTAKPAASTEQPTAPRERAFIYSASQHSDSPKPAAPTGAPVDEVPDALRKIREDPDRRMHPAALDYQDSGLEDALAESQMPEEARTAAVGSWKETFADLSLSTAEAKDLVSLARHTVAHMPDAATDQQWQAQAWAALVDTYGSDKDAKEALGLAQKLVARDPRLAYYLEVTRLGNHAKVVSLLAAKARSEAGRGRL